MEMQVKDRLAHTCPRIGDQPVARVIVTGPLDASQSQVRGNLTGHNENFGNRFGLVGG